MLPYLVCVVGVGSMWFNHRLVRPLPPDADPGAVERRASRLRNLAEHRANRLPAWLGPTVFAAFAAMAYAIGSRDWWVWLAAAAVSHAARRVRTHTAAEARREIGMPGELTTNERAQGKHTARWLAVSGLAFAASGVVLALTQGDSVLTIVGLALMIAAFVAVFAAAWASTWIYRDAKGPTGS